MRRLGNADGEQPQRLRSASTGREVRGLGEEAPDCRRLQKNRATLQSGRPVGLFESRGASGSRLRSEAVIALLARLNIEVDEHNPADHRNETEKQPPAAAVDVVQAANADGNAGQD